MALYLHWMYVLLITETVHYGQQTTATDAPEEAEDGVTCTSVNCKHGGTCQLMSGGSILCNCVPGYAGEFCEQDMCGPGQYYANEQCRSCPLGSYSPAQSEDEHCVSCPVDSSGRPSTTDRAGRTDVSQCIFMALLQLLMPDYGPVSGGTLVELHFDLLNGRRAVVTSLLGKTCTNESVVNNTTLVCTTPAVDGPAAGPIEVMFSGETSALSTQNFTYRPDPVIISIDNIKTFISGGMVITVRGEHLDSIYHPVMVVTRVYKDNIREFTSNYTDNTGTELDFYIPRLTEGLPTVIGSEDSSRRRRRALESGTFNDLDFHFYLGFRMDGVNDYRNMSTSPLPQYGELLVYYDPVYKPFEEDDLIRDFVMDVDEFIRIMGERLKYASQISDITVTIGTDTCNITLLATNQLTCRPPSRKPQFETSDYAPGGKPRVTVYVGSLVFVIGYLNYVRQEEGVSDVVIAVVVMAAVVVAVIVMGIAIMYGMRRRSHRRRHQVNKEDIVRLGGVVASRPSNLYYVHGFVSDNPSGDDLTGLPSETGSSLSLVTRTSSGRGLLASVTPPSTPLVLSIHSGAYSNSGSASLYNEADIRFNIMDEIEEDMKAAVEECRIDSSRLTLGEVIGQGYFGKVYRGELINHRSDTRLTVAVKTLLGGHHTAKDLASFLSEAILMRDMKDHPNVLSLLGLVITDNKPYVVLPFMQHGDLKSYIKSPSRSITVRELLGFGVQIANGMCYLAKQKFVHRDLATRNCMLNESLTVTVADFGLSRDVYRTDYYRVEDKRRPLPVRWMAIESLTTGVFTSKSDVWSYGVVLWELLTRGCSPYPDVDSFNIKSYVLSGRRMTQPEHAPDDVFSLMSGCWEEEANQRPSFDDVHQQLTDIIDKGSANNRHEYLQLVDI